MKCQIYRIIYLKDNSTYVGQHKMQENEDPMFYLGSGSIVSRIRKKHGDSVLRKEIIWEGEFTNQDELDELEIKYIKEEKEQGRGQMNIASGGWHIPRYGMTHEVLAAVTKKGCHEKRSNNDEYKENMSNRMTDWWKKRKEKLGNELKFDFSKRKGNLSENRCHPIECVETGEQWKNAYELEKEKQISVRRVIHAALYGKIYLTKHWKIRYDLPITRPKIGKRQRRIKELNSGLIFPTLGKAADHFKDYLKPHCNSYFAEPRKVLSHIIKEVNGEIENLKFIDLGWEI